MLGGEDEVALAGVLCGLSPVRRPVPFRIELAGGALFVFRGRPLFLVHHPFAARQDRIGAPMDELPEARLPPPAHPGVALCGGFAIRVAGENEPIEVDPAVRKDEEKVVQAVDFLQGSVVLLEDVLPACRRQ